MQTRNSPRFLRGPRVAVYLSLAVAAMALAVVPRIEERIARSSLWHLADAGPETPALGAIDRRTVVFLRAAPGN
jgi:hypothetical protein